MRRQENFTVDSLLQLRKVVLGRSEGDSDEAVQREFVAIQDGVASLAEISEAWFSSAEFAYKFPLFFHRYMNRVITDHYVPIRQAMHRQVVHVHIPKTGGTALNYALSEHLDPFRAFTQRTVREVFSYGLDILRQVPLVACHGGKLLLDVFEPLDAVFVTVLRDPLDQIWSNYWHYIREQVISSDVTFEEWCSDENNMNPQAVSLTRDLKNMTAESMELSGIPHPNRIDLLSAAIDSLERMSIVGFSDSIQETLARVAAQSGSKELDRIEIGRRNATAPTRASRQLLKTRAVQMAIEVDWDLYQWARGRFG